MDSERGMRELEDDLHATAEDVFADASDLKAIEKVKATIPPDDPRTLALAKKADQLAEKIAAKTASELALAKEATGAS